MIPIILCVLFLVIGKLINDSLPEGTEPKNPVTTGFSVAWNTFWQSILVEPEENDTGMPRGPSSPETCNIMPDSEQGHVLTQNHARTHDSNEPSDLAYTRTRILRQIQVRDSRGRFTDRWTEIEIDND